jgi:hypothetical protein
MAIVTCKDCNTEISSEATSCPKCGKPTAATKNVNALRGILGLAVFVGLVWFFFGSGLQQQAATSMHGIQDQVASDAVKQYNIAANQGDKTQKCVQAGIVSAAYLQAQDSENYNTWKAIEQADCTVAGLPNQ